MTLIKSLRTIVYKIILGSNYREIIPEENRLWLEIKDPSDLKEGDIVSILEPNFFYRIEPDGDFQYVLIEKNKEGFLRRRVFYVNQNKFHFPISFSENLKFHLGVWKLIETKRYDPNQEPEDDCL